MSPSPSLMPVLTSFSQGFAGNGADSFEPLSPCSSDAPSNNNAFQLSPAHAVPTAARSPSCRVAVSARRTRAKRVDYVKLSQVDMSSEGRGSAQELEDDAGFDVHMPNIDRKRSTADGRPDIALATYAVLLKLGAF